MPAIDSTTVPGATPAGALSPPIQGAAGRGEPGVEPGTPPGSGVGEDLLGATVLEDDADSAGASSVDAHNQKRLRLSGEPEHTDEIAEARFLCTSLAEIEVHHQAGAG